MTPKGNQKTSKNRCPKKGRLQDAPGHLAGNPFGVFLVERVAPGIDFGGHFGARFHQKCDPKSIPKSNLKKTRKTLKINRKNDAKNTENLWIYNLGTACWLCRIISFTYVRMTFSKNPKFEKWGLLIEKSVQKHPRNSDAEIIENIRNSMPK